MLLVPAPRERGIRYGSVEEMLMAPATGNTNSCNRLLARTCPCYFQGLLRQQHAHAVEPRTHADGNGRISHVGDEAGAVPAAQDVGLARVLPGAIGVVAAGIAGRVIEDIGPG